MIIVMKAGRSEQEIQQVADAVKQFGYEPKLIRGIERTIIALCRDQAIITRSSPRISFGSYPNCFTASPPVEFPAPIFLPSSQ